MAFIALATVYVVDTKTGAVRDTLSAGASNDALAISGNGRYLAYGWTSLFLREWDGSSYVPRWSRARGGVTLTALVLSADEETLVAAWKPASSNQNSVELHDPASSTPSWTYTYDLHGGQLQDTIPNLAITRNGSHVAVPSWGDDLNTNPEVHVFEREQPEPPEPALTLDTPGSMFDIDIARGPRGRIHVAAGGKHIHANTSGRGGDLYSILLETDCNADIDGNAVIDFDDLLAVLSAWGPYEECPPYRVEDLDEDCDVGFSDLLQVLSTWGGCD